MFGANAAKSYHSKPIKKNPVKNIVHSTLTILKVYNSLNSLAISKVRHILTFDVYFPISFITSLLKLVSKSYGLQISVFSQSTKNISKSAYE